MKLRQSLHPLLIAAALCSAPAFGQDSQPPKAKPSPTKLGTAAQSKKSTEKTAESAAPAESPSAPHPPVAGAKSPHGAPGAHNFANQRPPQDRSSPDPSVPAGTVVVQVVDENNAPVRGAIVKLLTAFMSVAEGNSEDVQTAQTNAQGEATFKDLKTAIRFSYAASVETRGATYDVGQFQLKKVGHRVLVHTYPVTSDPKAAFVGLQSSIAVTVNEDLIRTDVFYRILNMSRTTWKPNPIFIKLPEDAEAIDAKLSVGDAGYEEAPGGVHLVGTFPPGQKDIPFTFYVPNRNEESQTITMGTPPHTVEMTVYTSEAPDLELTVSPGFQRAVSRVGRDNKKALVTRRTMRAGDGQLGSITIELSGLPVLGPGRWIAVAIAFLIAALGALGLWVRRNESGDELKEQRKKARATLLDEMLLLEHAHKEGEIGPRTYEQTRREILAALARLEPAIA